MEPRAVRGLGDVWRKPWGTTFPESFPRNTCVFRQGDLDAPQSVLPIGRRLALVGFHVTRASRPSGEHRGSAFDIPYAGA